MSVSTSKITGKTYLPIFINEAISEVYGDNKAGKIDASYTLWSMLAIESWLKQFGNTN